MKCPICGSWQVRAIDSRMTSDEKKRRRRYKCQDCDYRFTTYEYRGEDLLDAIDKIGEFAKALEKGAKQLHE